MRAAFASAFNDEDPLAALTIGDAPEPAQHKPGQAEQPGQPGQADWSVVDVRASALNHHDLWSLRGVGLTEAQLPMILGCDAAGIAPDGSEVVVYSVVVSPEGKPSILSEQYPGTIAERVAVPAYNLVPKPPELSFAEAACLPTAWLTAYTMLTTKGRLSAGDAVLVQGAGGGVATAAVVLAGALGARVYATSRDPGKRERIEALGATALETGARLPERVDVVIETVGKPTFEHSMKACKLGGRIVVSGATAGHLVEINLRRVFALHLEILGTSMGTPSELADLMALLGRTGARPVIDSIIPFSKARDAFEKLHSGDVFGKIVLDHTA